MRKLQYDLKFLTPAFLGNAEQQGQWRTPPFKALLRQWWRVVYAADRGFRVDMDAMRCSEGDLFGSVHSKKPQKSRVRLRLSHWSMGKLDQWQKNLSNDLAYLGYGPLSDKRQAIKDREKAVLSLLVPSDEAERIEHAVALMSAYGTLGSRSRNGWGSLRILDLSTQVDLTQFQRPWREAMATDWPHAIGSSEKRALAWKTTSSEHWQQVMKNLSKVRKDLAKHNDRDWRNKRIPNSLRFKVREEAGQLFGVVFHMPCSLPESFRPNANKLKEIWVKAHSLLDREMERIGQ